MPPAMCLVTPVPRKKIHLQGVGIAEQQKVGKKAIIPTLFPCFCGFVIPTSPYIFIVILLGRAK